MPRLPSFHPIAPVPNLTGNLADMLQGRIEAGELAPGQQLPTEQAIVSSTGVSRTVVREALATLRARGLIVTRQGRGAFVAEPPVAPPSFTIRQPVVEAGSLAEILRIVELRVAIEAEAAGLAASRRTETDLDDMERHLDALERSGMRLEARFEHDFAFHRAIHTATGNPYFAEVFAVVGDFVFSRRKQQLDEMAASSSTSYLDRLGREHRAILVAIREGNAAAASRAMREHLGGAHARYQAMVGQAAGATSRETESRADLRE